MLKTILALCAALSAAAFAPAALAQDAAPVLIMLAVGSNAEGFNDDTTLSAGGEPVGGMVVLRLNGNAIAFHTMAGTILTINQMLKPGENTLSIEGKFEKTLYVKIARVQGGQLLGIDAKKAVAKDADAAGRAIAFKADLAYTPPLYQNAAKIEDTPAARDEIWAAIDRLQKDVAAGRADAAAAGMFAGPRVWIVKCFGVRADALAQMIEQQKDFIGSIRETLQPLAKADVKYVFGPNSVLVYAGLQGPPQAAPFLFVLRQGDQAQYLPHFIFVRGPGGWSVW